MSRISFKPKKINKLDPRLKTTKSLLKQEATALPSELESVLNREQLIQDTEPIKNRF